MVLSSALKLAFEVRTASAAIGVSLFAVSSIEQRMIRVCTAARTQDAEPMSAALVLSRSRLQSDQVLIETGMYMSMGSRSESSMRSYQ